jgi:RNA polymerase primary sigma factor
MLIQEHGRQPRDEEIAELVGLTVEKLQSVVKSAKAPGSMERPIGKERDTTVGVSPQVKVLPSASQPFDLSLR